MVDAAQFYANRVLKEFKEKDPIHSEWVKEWMKVLSELNAYVQQHHTTGLTWCEYEEQNSGIADVSISNSGGMALPPPPPPLSSSPEAVQTHDGQLRTELMDSINALGTDAVSHLKKVPDELKLHKNPQLRDQPTNCPFEQSNVPKKSQVGPIFVFNITTKIPFCFLR